MVSLRRHKRSSLSPAGSSYVPAPLPGFTDSEIDTHAKLDCVHPMPLNDEDEPEELSLPKETKTVSVLNSAKRKMRKIDELMKITETEVIESPKVDLKKPVRRWKKVLEKKKSPKVSEVTKDELEKIVKKLGTNSDFYLEELDLLHKKKENESKLTTELIKTCQKELKEAEDNNHAFSWDYCLLDKSYVQSLENIWLEGEDQNVDDEGTDTLGNEEAKNKIDISEDWVNKLKEKKGLQKAELDAAKVETEKLCRYVVELDRVAVDMAKAQAAAIKAEKDEVEEQTEEMKNKIDILKTMVEKLKDKKILQKAEAEAAMVACEKLCRDAELSRVAVDMAKAETSTLKAEKDKLEEQNEIEMRKKRKYIAALISELKSCYSFRTDPKMSS
ncbi:hypothetical protein RchiOBHm_Chr6g0284051 [Rosa chinensis]|uniref:Uncharacterized protein n=1 Tax=Rosa chinensis TaxID=74649 RepID=A0A2P6PU76_ROSCH|nr:uncharacterized abhydrolase domain-containing protein DDB_G0269086 isoform X2 [Rosa chinensis]PRQ25473.1 hypothetical protein RchiOBHm_Chr6g0284051 [Rosa chinensis]